MVKTDNHSRLVGDVASVVEEGVGEEVTELDDPVLRNDQPIFSQQRAHVVKLHRVHQHDERFLHNICENSLSCKKETKLMLARFFFYNAH